MSPPAGSLAALARVRGSGPATRTAPRSSETDGPARIADQAQPAVLERCDLCSEVVGAEHDHLVDVRNRNLVCACRACYLLFSNPGAGSGHLRAVPDRYRVVRDFALSDLQWDALQIPVSVAFFFHNSDRDGVVAFFPSPAGATECLLPLEAWGEVATSNPVLETLTPDVEAALVRVRRQREASLEPECFLVPIDSCYELVGRLRTLWRGFDGGAEAHAAMDEHFERLATRGRRVDRTGQTDG